MNNFTIKPRVGLIVPSVQSVTEPLFNKSLGKKYDFLAHRMRLAGGKLEDLVEMEKGIPDAVTALRDSGVELLVYCCAGSGAIQGQEKESRLCEQVEAEFGIPMISTMKCCSAALKSAQAKKLTMIGPNTPEVEHTEVVYLEKDGFEINGQYGFGIEDGRLFSRIHPDVIAEKAIENWNTDSDAMFIACMNWHAVPAVPKIRAEIGRHVITSHTAAMWSICCALDGELPYEDFAGRIYEK